ncbi:MAG: hypothetical protein HZA20_04665 [Nitrospirae bacterium]|nr:hypothetical protein [Nitrospirota bacterium]
MSNNVIGGDYKVRSKFGPRVPPTGGASKDHKGIDYGAKQGTGILAYDDGTVNSRSHTFRIMGIISIAVLLVTLELATAFSYAQSSDNTKVINTVSKYDATLEIDEFVYKFETLPDHSHLDRDFIGKITVSSKGNVVYQEIDGLRPGCEFQTISSVSTQTNGRKKQLIVFCGSYGGGSQTIKVLHHEEPHTPAFLAFGRTIPNLADLNNDGQLEAMVYVREYDPEFLSTYNYLIVYKLLNTKGLFGFAPYFGHDIASVYLQYYSDITKENIAKDDYKVIAPSVAALIATHDKGTICREVNNLIKKGVSLDNITASTRKAVLHGYPDFDITVCKEAF